MPIRARDIVGPLVLTLILIGLIAVMFLGNLIR